MIIWIRIRQRIPFSNKDCHYYDYLMKPCDIDQLMQKVEEATQKKRLHEDKIREAKVKEAMSMHGLE